ALLNNDCLWVMDEVQLMGSGLATTTQLQAFRSILGCAVSVRSIWMSATLSTDLAPWPSLVQRFGRCNRDGAEEDAGVIWLALDPAKKNQVAPYTREELTEAAEILENLDDAAPNRLPPVSSGAEETTVVRRKDILDLFDATPDLSGMDLDISRFIRDSDEHDLQVFWRDIPLNARPSNEEPAPDRDEVCPAPVSEVGKMTDVDMWRWDPLEKRWARPGALHPGIVLMFRRADGGYDSEFGWSGKSGDKPGP
ncbi:MAG: hypothetical protein GY859_05900, partial [Desulfobacterales bacterium]|nr:hypothetical protein [Desulfobacterales bacterium]